MSSSSFSKHFGHLQIPLLDILSATNNFSNRNLIGENEIKKAYKGKLSRFEQQIDIDVVAERLLGTDHDKKAILQTEISTASSFKHENLVSIVGFCDEEDEKIIIYKHEANGSLGEHLGDQSLTWIQRLEICVGVARALSYIHYDKERNFSFIHRNINSSQILLDVNWNPKLSGFEFSKMITTARRNRLHLITYNGTTGYEDPSYNKTRIVTHKTDVYSFGVVLFEILCGRPAYIPLPQDLKEKEESLQNVVVGKLDRILEDDEDSVGKLDEIGLSDHFHQAPKLPSFGAFWEPPNTWQDTTDNSRMPPSFSESQNMRQEPSFMSARHSMTGMNFRSAYRQFIHEFGDESSEEELPAPSPVFNSFSERPEKDLLAPLAIFHYDDGTLEDIIHVADLCKQMDKDSFKIFSETAYLCLKEKQSERLHIDQIIIRLVNALHLQNKHEKSFMKLEEKSQVEATSTNHSKWKDMEHLMIGIDHIKEATMEFTQILIGSGAFGNVYKAELQHFDSENYSTVEVKNLSDLPKISSTVAVKVLLKRKGAQTDKSFSAEIQTLTGCKHDNIVSLLGFCDEDSEMILVYEYVPNGSLDDHLRSKDKMINLKWAMRLQICLDIAEGLNYLHTKKKIIHRDIKSANILLDDKCRAKIGDFGLSRIVPQSQELSFLRTKVSGTRVYLDPEYTNTKILRAASDIYSFGVVLFEIVSGTLANDPKYTKENPKGLAHVARQHYTKGTLASLLDPILKEEVDENNFTLSKGPNQGSLNVILNIAHKCLAETHAIRPNIGDVVNKIKDALKLQENHKDNLKISLEDISSATNIFSVNNLVARGGSASVYRGEVTHANRGHTIAAKKLDSDSDQHRTEFMMELEILQDYKHESIIGLVGFCNEKAENIIVYEFASRGSLDMHLKDYDLTWMKRLQISTDIASGLYFLHGSRGDTQELVMHRDIKSASILLTNDWKAKICDFGLSIISPINNEMDFANDNACGAIDYRDPLYSKFGYLTEHSDIYSFGVVLIEILCGRLVHEDKNLQIPVLTGLFEDHYKEKTLDDIMFEGIKGRPVPESLTTFQEIAHRCLDHERENRPTAGDVLVELTKALEVQEDHDIWKAKLPSDYEKIFKMSKESKTYNTKKKKDLYNMLCKGILLQQDKVFFSLGKNGERSEMISARKFLYKYRRSYMCRSIPKSRFHGVVELPDPSNLNIGIKIRPKLLARGVKYSVHLVFKFCGPRKSKAKGMYVNLKYKMRSEPLHAYFATWREDEWMTAELGRFSNNSDNTDFEFLLKSFSRLYCGSGAIYVEGIEFRAIDNVKHEETENSEEVQQVLKPNLNRDHVELLPTNVDKLGWRFENYEGKVHKNKGYILSAKEADAFYESADVKLFNSNPSTQTRFQEEFELPSQQVFRIKCKIESQRLSLDTDYACYLVFKLSEKCRGLHCPVIVRDLLKRRNKKKEIIYFRSPSPSNVNDAIRVPEVREDGWTEVNVWQFNSIKELRDNCVPIRLKLISYEGTMSGLIVGGLEFRPL